MKLKWLPIVLIILSVAAGIYFYPMLPERVASHWNAAGEVDGYMNRFWGAFLLPIILILIYLLMVIVPGIDPKKENIKKFEDAYQYFILLMMAFFAYLYGLTIYWNLGNHFNFSIYLVPAFAILFFYIGHMVKIAKQNYTIGIRTPWTLASQEVWDKTHKLGGLLFQVSAIVSLFGLIWQDIAFWFVIIPILATALFAFVYSYIIYKRLLK